MTDFTFRADWTDPNRPRLIIKATSEQDSKTFFDQFQVFAKNANFDSVMTYDNATNEVVFAASNGRGTPGVYQSDKGCLAINFNSGELRDLFLLYFSGLRKAGIAPDIMAGTGAFYFHSEVMCATGSRFIESVQVVTPILGISDPVRTVTFPLYEFTEQELMKTVANAPKLVSANVGWNGSGMTFFNNQHTATPNAPEQKSSWLDVIKAFLKQLRDGIIAMFECMKSKFKSSAQASACHNP